MTRYIEPFYFFISLFIGMFLVYISTPAPDIIIKYPLPDEVNDIVYKDDGEMCYKYDVTEVDCDQNEVNEFEVQYRDGGNGNIFDRIKQNLK